MLILFNSEFGNYQNWQAELLHFQLKKYFGHLHCYHLLSGTNKKILDCQTMCLANQRKQENDDYPPYNKPYALASFLDKHYEDIPDILLLLDPDMILLNNFNIQHLQKNVILSQSWEQISCETKNFDKFNLKIKPQNVGFPILINKENLKQIAWRWFELTKIIRKDYPDNWCVEMLAYCVACAEQGLQNDSLANLASTPFDNFEHAKVFHYCFHIKKDGFFWDKRQYKPNTHINYPKDLPVNCIKFFNSLNELVESKKKHLI